MANTYTYSGPGTRWATGNATTIGRLNVSRVNADHLYEAVNKICNTANSNGFLVPTIVDATGATVKDIEVLSWAPAGGNGTANQGLARAWQMEDSAGTLEVVARELVRETTVTSGSEQVEFEWQAMRAGTLATIFKLFASNRSACVVGGDMGSGVVGPFIQVERNTNATPTPGCLSVMDKAGTVYWIWVDTSGKLRVNATTQPGNTDTIGTIVGTQT
jgi:hypothetical protein